MLLLRRQRWRVLDSTTHRQPRLLFVCRAIMSYNTPLPTPPGPPSSAPPPPPSAPPPVFMRNPSLAQTFAHSNSASANAAPPPAPPIDDDAPADVGSSGGNGGGGGSGIVPAGGISLPKPKGKVMVLNALQRELIRELEDIFGAPWGMEAVVKGLKTNKEDAIQWIIRKQEQAEKKKSEAAKGGSSASISSGYSTPQSFSGASTPVSERPAVPPRQPSIAPTTPPTFSANTSATTASGTTTPTSTTGARSVFSTLSASVFGNRVGNDSLDSKSASVPSALAPMPMTTPSAVGDLTDPVEISKRAAAIQAVNDFITPTVKVIGVGSGSTVHYAIEHLMSLCKARKQFLQCVPTSFQAKLLILRGAPELTLAALDSVTTIDVAIDGADEVDDDLNLIKGGGGCALQEKCVASAAKQFVVICDSRKDSKKLGEQWKLGIPLEVLPMAHQLVTFRLLALGATQATLRISQSGKAGPVVTDNGNFIIDADFGVVTGKWTPEKLNIELSQIPGILETGLFINMCQKAYFGGVDGKVKVREAKAKSRSWIG